LAGTVGGVGEQPGEVVIVIDPIVVGVKGLDAASGVIVGEIGVVAGGVNDGVQCPAGAVVVMGDAAQGVGLRRAAADGVIGRIPLRTSE
jgi:hypothetical protein